MFVERLLKVFFIDFWKFLKSKDKFKISYKKNKRDKKVDRWKYNDRINEVDIKMKVLFISIIVRKLKNILIGYKISQSD